jgi:hypothetical protein
LATGGGTGYTDGCHHRAILKLLARLHLDDEARGVFDSVVLLLPFFSRVSTVTSGGKAAVFCTSILFVVTQGGG